MNTENNSRKRQSKKKIEKVFMELLQERELSSISVSEICKKTGLNRTTFYANYLDICDLADKIRESLENNLIEMYHIENTQIFKSNDYLRLFRHIYENQLFYRTYLKLGYNRKYNALRNDTEQAEKYFGGQFVNYHAEFFKAGITRIIEMWLESGCKETPEEMFEIVKSEYQGREVK